MTQDDPTHNSVAPLRNVAALATLIERIQNRDMNLPGMGTFYGPSGYGKTFAAIFAQNKFGAINIQVKSTWSKKKFLTAVLAEMAIKPRFSVADMCDQVAEHLALTDRPLIIDEADFLLRHGMIEIARDIYESSQAPVILIGEELLPQKLSGVERVHGRMLDWVSAEPADMNDLKQLAKMHAEGLTMAEDLRRAILAASTQSLRRIAVNLSRVREFARGRGLSTVSLADWGDQRFFSGEAPLPRDLRAGVRRRASA